ncbi:prefoldin subunit alpha [Candidatus Woesearchaeota archaeon]|nr:prefoldin subunit alpha [Candidatus Woesearchaeota archaeon]
MEKATVKTSAPRAQLDAAAEQKRVQELKEKYTEYQLIEEQVKEIKQQVQKMDGQLADLVSIQEGLEDFKTVADGSEVLVPVSNGIFLQANLASNKKLLVNVGSSVVVEKSFDDTQKLLGDQEVEISIYREQLLAHLNKMLVQMQHLQEQLEKMINEQVPERTH